MQPRVFRQAEQADTARVLTLTVGSSDTAQIRTETLAGREYTVVPVIALVEGVLQGANSTEPEFAAATEFGKFPSSWDGRPVVLRHPQIQGIYVSANLPQITEDFRMGSLYNTKVEDAKLKTEAWLDNARIAELGGEFLDALTSIQAGEVMNVSVGAFIDTRTATGIFKGKQYSSRWENVIPDHLALLPDQVGACSLADGCGTNRVAAAATAEGFALRNLQYLTEGCGGHCCSSCAEGAPCMAANATGETGQALPAEPATPPASPSPTAPTPTPTPTPAPAPGTSEPALPSTPAAPAVDELEPAALAARAQFGEDRLQVLAGLAANALGDQVVLDDAQRLVAQALPARLSVESWAVDLLAATADVAVFMAWGEPNIRGFHQIRYSVSNDGKVTFTGEPEPVNLMTRIMPRQTGQMNANAAGIISGSTNSEEDGAMADTGQGSGAAAPNAATGEEGTGTGSAAAPAPSVQAEPTPASPTPAAPAAPVAEVSVEDYLKSAPGPVARVLQAALDNEKALKDTLVKGIKANSRNTLTDEQLEGMSLDQLKGIAAFAAPEVASYEGRSGFGGDGADGLTLNANQGSAGVSSFAEVDTNYLMATPAGNA
jgi:hypothetical protein